MITGRWSRRSLISLAAMMLVSSACGVGPRPGPESRGGERESVSFDRLPLYFVENQGQAGPKVDYFVPGDELSVGFGTDGLTYRLGPDHGDRPWTVHGDFLGANPRVAVRGIGHARASFGWFVGPPDDHRSRVPSYRGVAYEGLWPGISARWEGVAGSLKSTFRVEPRADPSRIRLGFRGATDVRVRPGGDLSISTPTTDFGEEAPVAWQVIGGRRRPVEVSWSVRRSVARFRVGPYDRNQPLVIDPATIGYSGFVGGGGMDEGRGVVVDANNNVYVTGGTFSSQTTFPETVGPDLAFNGVRDAFVAKLRPNGSGLVFAGYIGGAGDDLGDAIAVDQSGNVFVAGATSSNHSSFPETIGPDLTHNGSYDAFVAKVRANGTGLVYGGYIGGSGSDIGYGIAVDQSGSAYVSGGTQSDQNTFPDVTGPDSTYNGAGDGFVAKVRADGVSLAYAGYIGGSGEDAGGGVAVDPAGNAYLTGSTVSNQSTFPERVGPDLAHNGVHDAFVAKVRADGTSLVYGGYIGGQAGDVGLDIDVDQNGAAYVIGTTDSSQTTFPEVVGPDLTHNRNADAFLAKVRTDGTGLVYAGYLGGNDVDFGHGIAVDQGGRAHVTGLTYSDQGTFPETSGPDLRYNGAVDAYVARVRSDGAALEYAGYLGGTMHDSGDAIAVDRSGNAYVTGVTGGGGFPVATGPDTSHNGGHDAFVTSVRPK